MEEKQSGEPGGSAKVDPKTTFLPIPQEERASNAIVAEAKKLPIPTKDPSGDPINMILDNKLADRKAITQPTTKKGN